ncbi:hypothetical protein [Pseudoalteromonas rhizosphaerae]|uniref:hypothetical protein n=1 Tax=Pseudoalteromonas rhizosphaerae TaxID=2518973 RepID=UPI0012317DC2|nr:hypothetical protein [Pseudoalteromonas rhizosphaerae]
MCRIDAPFGNITFDEKNDPKERFIQALDEFDIQGNFRTLMIKHFSDTWMNVFRGALALEEALAETKPHTSESAKCISILLTQQKTIENCIFSFYEGYRAPLNNELIIAFLKDVADIYYPNALFGLFNDGMDKCGSYIMFSSWLYGKDYCLTKAFFDDTSLCLLSDSDRAIVLWSFFDEISHRLQSLDSKRLYKAMTYIANSNVVQGPQIEEITNTSTNIIRGLDFIRAWITYDSQAGRFNYKWFDFLYFYNKSFSNLDDSISLELIDSDETQTLNYEWLENTKLELQELLYINTNLDNVPSEEHVRWAQELDGYFSSFKSRNFERHYNYSNSNIIDLYRRKDNAHHEFCLKLKPLQISTWIEFSIKEDFRRLLESKPSQFRGELKDSVDLWGYDKHFTSWKKVFLVALEELDYQSKLRILSCSIPFNSRRAEDLYPECAAWWNELFTDLIDAKDFPKALIPDWAVTGIDRLEREEMVPYIDKSIGIIRGEIVKVENKDHLETYHQKLDRLLSFLDRSAPDKALRHRLFLMRSSTEPFSDEALAKFNCLFERKGFSKWYDSLKQLAAEQCAKKINENRSLTIAKHEQVEKDFYVQFSQQLAEFCLSRLRIRKGEKAKDDKYETSQVTEQSSVWRQGYLKALTELGLDLNGKVHKTVNFTKKSDPNEDVRAIASECYKAVRRHAKKDASVQDIKRSIIAAEWWLLMCQRTELGHKNHSEKALRTRRNLMRNT